MIDYIDITIPCKHVALGSRIDYTNETTGEVKRYRSAVKVKNIYKNTLMIKSEGDGNFLNIRGNFVKFIQGHNIFGSNNLKGIVTVVVERVLKQLSIPITKYELDYIKLGNFQVHMVDIAWGYRQFPGTIPFIIDEIGETWRNRGENVSNYRNETVYLDQHSKKSAFKLYNKRLELASKPLPENLPYREKLLEYSESILRAEVRLYRLALHGNGLNMGVNWSIDTVKALIELAVTQARFGGSIRRRFVPKDAKNLKPNLRIAYTLWADNHDLTELYGPQVLRRLKKQFTLMNLNISKPPPKVETEEMHLLELIKLSRKVNYPKWAVKKGLIYIPKK